MKIGVISDTHDYLDPKVLKLFAGVDHILHGGDVGSAFITFELEQIAPVTAVLGNTDSSLSLRETEVLTLADRKFFVHHIVTPHALTDSLKARLNRERPNVVVFGHTHKPFSETISGILFFNPGYAGKPRFGMERSVAVLHFSNDGIRPQYHAL